MNGRFSSEACTQEGYQVYPSFVQLDLAAAVAVSALRTRREHAVYDAIYERLALEARAGSESAARLRRCGARS